MTRTEEDTKRAQEAKLKRTGRKPEAVQTEGRMFFSKPLIDIDE